jgi:hypothetical protein
MLLGLRVCCADYIERSAGQGKRSRQLSEIHLKHGYFQPLASFRGSPRRRHAHLRIPKTRRRHGSGQQLWAAVDGAPIGRGKFLIMQHWPHGQDPIP